MEPSHRSGRLDSSAPGPSRGRGGPGDHHRPGAEQGPQGEVPGEPALHVQDGPARDDPRDPDPSDQSRPPGARPQPRGRQRQQRSEGELPQPRERAEVGRLLVVRGVDDRVGQRRGEHRREGRAQRTARIPSAAAGQADHGQDQQRPQDEHLTLHRQRPEVLQRAEPVAAVVVDGDRGELAVLHVEQGCPGLPPDRRPVGCREPQSHDEQRRGDHRGRRREQACEAARPEPEKRRERSVRLDPPHDRQGEEVGGHHEEDIHPARDPAEPHVVDHDEGDRQGSEAVNVRAVGAGGVGAGPAPIGAGEGQLHLMRAGCSTG